MSEHELPSCLQQTVGEPTTDEQRKHGIMDDFGIQSGAGRGYQFIATTASSSSANAEVNFKKETGHSVDPGKTPTRPSHLAEK